MPSLLTPQHMNFTVGQVMLNLCLSFALAFIAATLYRRMHGGASSPYSFFVTMLVTPVVVAMIMMAIGSNIALSLGLVGALSIIRFRTVIKDTRDMSILFLAIGIGLCCGSGAYALAIFGTGFVCFVLMAVHFASRARFGIAEYILVFTRRTKNNSNAEDALDGLVSWRKLHGVADLGDEEGCEYTYRIRLGNMITPEAFMERLTGMEGLSRSSLISPESQLAI